MLHQSSEGRQRALHWAPEALGNQGHSGWSFVWGSACFEASSSVQGYLERLAPSSTPGLPLQLLKDGPPSTGATLGAPRRNNVVLIFNLHSNWPNARCSHRSTYGMIGYCTLLYHSSCQYLTLLTHKNSNVLLSQPIKTLYYIMLSERLILKFKYIIIKGIKVSITNIIRNYCSARNNVQKLNQYILEYVVYYT